MGLRKWWTMYWYGHPCLVRSTYSSNDPRWVVGECEHNIMSQILQLNQIWDEIDPQPGSTVKAVRIESWDHNSVSVKTLAQFSQFGGIGHTYPVKYFHINFRRRESAG